MGRRENKNMNCEGRVPFDLLLVRLSTTLVNPLPLHLNSPHSDTQPVCLIVHSYATF
jgi:hypothetical protein